MNKAAALLSLLFLPGSASAAPERSVILIVVDALRPDHLGAYGYGRNTSPNIDKLAKSGSLFHEAISQSNWTLPALGSIMTGLYPSVHGAHRFPDLRSFMISLEKKEEYESGSGGRLDDSNLTLAEVLRARGYVTGGFVSGAICRSEFGFGQGFDSYLNFGGNLEELNKKVFPWLEGLRGKKFFLYLHAPDVHDPYETTPRFDRLWDPDYRGKIDGRRATLNAITRGELTVSPRDLEHLIALYDGGISYTDEQLGRFFKKLERLGLAENAIIVLTSDHGEMFMEHGRITHGRTLYDPVIKVPLIVKIPGKKTTPRVSAQVRSIDIFPTILDLLGLPAAEGVQGVSLLPLLEGRPMSELVAYVESGARFIAKDREGVGVRTLKWKYIHRFDGKPAELYDLERDPGEKLNLAQEQPAVTDQFRRYYESWDQAVTALGRRGSGDGYPALSEDVKKELRRLGYLQ
jgi:arylsulfatase A-like enzyme